MVDTLKVRPPRQLGNFSPTIGPIRRLDSVPSMPVGGVHLPEVRRSVVRLRLFVVEPAGDDRNFVRFDGVDETMLLVDAT